jgi:hypothetical protein
MFLLVRQAWREGIAQITEKNTTPHILPAEDLA